MEKTFKERLNHWWSEPNPEGVSTRDVVFVMTFFFSFVFIAFNSYFYLNNHPEVVESVANFIFPAKNW